MFSQGRISIDNPYFYEFISDIHSPYLNLNKSNTDDENALFLDFLLFINNNTVAAKFSDKREDFHFEIVNFSSLDGDVSRNTSYGVYFSQLIQIQLLLQLMSFY